MIPVTRPWLPDKDKYMEYIGRCYENHQLTNNGPLAQELKARLEEYLGVENLLLVANGTLALQIAYKTLGVSGKAITTPFTFVATSSSLRWEGIEPVYADIDEGTLNLSPHKAREAIDPDVTAIVPVHVYGNPCDVEAFDRIAKEHDLKIIYDAAHAFGVRLNGESILKWGDAATLSLHATKVFHTVEGGAIIFKKKEDYDRACRLINFGYEDGEVVDEGINAKMSEFHAAMGLCMLDEIDNIHKNREEVYYRYHESLKDHFEMPVWNEGATRNYAYFPVLFPSEQALLRAQQRLNEAGVYPRRYFYPSLDEVRHCRSDRYNSISRDRTRRVLCLPMYAKLPFSTQEQVISSLISLEYL
ncbi:aminotransferase DegT [Methanocalculus chunghsingensis]|uniref:Aminotransferase DegT n=1 Tax=Methanocalculus chunghsingensis TaxID=156457 RepID=A0A8J8B411_9EURY|nr:DegT/DnrJ/EryC1/StrS family aminotransferase [Methanocalculus chunghsingensis]MBR1368231.1 aminotransferase DegT [Methanocalculus chunghsingensis]